MLKTFCKDSIAFKFFNVAKFVNEKSHRELLTNIVKESSLKCDAY